MSDSYAEAGPEYLAQLLDAAVRAPAASGEPASGRIAAGVLVALASKGEDERVEPYLSWGTGRRTRYEVRCYDEAEQLVGRERYATGGQAIRATATCSSRAGHTARVLAIADDGEERWMMAVRESVAIYRMPEPAEQPGPSHDDSDVVQEMRQLLTGMTVHVDATEIEQVVRGAIDELRPAQVVANGSSEGADRAHVEALARAVVTQIGGLIPSADEIAAEVTRRMAAAPAVPVSPAAGGPERRAGRDAGRNRRPRPAVRPSLVPTMDPAVEDALAVEDRGEGQSPGGGQSHYPGRPGPSLPPPRLPEPSPVDP